MNRRQVLEQWITGMGHQFEMPVPQDYEHEERAQNYHNICEQIRQDLNAVNWEQYFGLLRVYELLIGQGNFVQANAVRVVIENLWHQEFHELRDNWEGFFQDFIAQTLLV